MSTINIYLFGQPRICGFDGEIKLNTRKTLHILAYLWQHRDQRVPRMKLAQLFWPEVAEAKASANLHTSLWSIIQRLPESIIKDTIYAQWNHANQITVDVEQFLTLPPEQAIEHHSGPFLEDCDMPWAQEVGLSLRAKLLTYYRDLSAQYGYQDTQAALKLADKSLAINPLQENMHRMKMRLLVRSGDRLGALAQYRQCEKIIREEIDAAPSIETQELFKAILNQPALIFAETGSKNQSLPPVIADCQILKKQADDYFDDREWAAALKGYSVLAQSLMEPTLLAAIWVQVARCQSSLGQTDKALDALKEAAVHGNQTGGLAEARIYVTRGAIFYTQRNWQECISYIDRGHDILIQLPESIERNRELVSCYLRKGYATFEMGLIEESKTAFNAGIQLARQSGSIQALCLMLSGLIKNLLLEGNTIEARKYCDEGMVIVSGMKRPSAYEMAAKFANRSAEIHLEENNPKESIKLLTEALKLLDTGEIEEESIILYKNMGLAYSILGEHENAIRSLEMALAQAKKRNSDHYSEVEMVLREAIQRKGVIQNASTSI